MTDRLTRIADKSFAPDRAHFAFESLLECLNAGEIEACSDPFLSDLGSLLILSPPMLDTLRRHPDYLGWLDGQVRRARRDPETLTFPKEISYYDEQWADWNTEEKEDFFEKLRAFKRREYLFISHLDIAGMLSFSQTVDRLSVLADWVVQKALDQCRAILAAEESGRSDATIPKGGFAVIAMGKLGGRELNYSSDIDLIFCRRNPVSEKEMNFFSKLGERLVRALSKVDQEGFLYRTDMRLRPHGSTGPLVPTIDSLMNYYESWSEPWERQALIKARFIAGCEQVGNRFQSFVQTFTLSRQLEEAALEDVKRVKHIAENQYAVDSGIHLKQGPGGIRDIEFYVQFSQLTIGWRYREVRLQNTLQTIDALGRMKVLLEGEESILSLAYVFLRIVEHRLQLQALTAQAILPDSTEEIELIARGLGFGNSSAAGKMLLKVLNHYRSRVRDILERVYLAPGYLRLHDREEELAQLLSNRMPKERAHELLSQYGFRDIDKAWQNIRLLGLGPEGRLLPPADRRAFLEFVFPMLEVLGETVDPDQALHNLEDFATATGNRISFLRTLASRRPHLSRLTNLLALSNRCRQILSRHPEYFDGLARGYYLHEGRPESEMFTELMDRIGQSPLGVNREDVLRKYRKREVVRIAYRDLAGLADSLEISRELSDLATACLKAAVDWTRLPQLDPSDYRQERLHLVAMGKLGSRQLHYASDLDLIFLYDPVADVNPETRARFQSYQEERVEQFLELFAGVTPEGLAYEIDLRLRPEGASGILARSWESFFEYAGKYMQPWERMALVRSRMLDESSDALQRWDEFLSAVVYEHDWSEEAYDSIRHVKRRIEREKSRETKAHLDFKYGKGGIADIEFLIQFLQIKHGKNSTNVRVPGPKDALLALYEDGVLNGQEKDTLLAALGFERLVENRYQLMEEWTSRELSRKSPLLVRLAGSMGYRGDESSVRRTFVKDWDDTARSVRELVEKYFYK